MCQMRVWSSTAGPYCGYVYRTVSFKGYARLFNLRKAALVVPHARLSAIAGPGNVW